jgi:hypothetical protein
MPAKLVQTKVKKVCENIQVHERRSLCALVDTQRAPRAVKMKSANLKHRSLREIFGQSQRSTCASTAPFAAHGAQNFKTQSAMTCNMARLSTNEHLVTPMMKAWHIPTIVIGPALATATASLLLSEFLKRPSEQHMRTAAPGRKGVGNEDDGNQQQMSMEVSMAFA